MGRSDGSCVKGRSLRRELGWGTNMVLCGSLWSLQGLSLRRCATHAQQKEMYRGMGVTKTFPGTIRGGPEFRSAFGMGGKVNVSKQFLKHCYLVPPR